MPVLSPSAPHSRRKLLRGVYQADWFSAKSPARSAPGGRAGRRGPQGPPCCVLAMPAWLLTPPMTWCSVSPTWRSSRGSGRASGLLPMSGRVQSEARWACFYQPAATAVVQCNRSVALL
jgi:hypothetical protein